MPDLTRVVKSGRLFVKALLIMKRVKEETGKMRREEAGIASDIREE